MFWFYSRITVVKLKELFDTGFGNKRRLLSVNDIVHQKGEAICSILPAFHCLTGCDTTSAFVRKGKISPLNLVEKKAEYISMLTMLGQEHEYSNQLLTEIEKFVFLYMDSQSIQTSKS